MNATLQSMKNHKSIRKYNQKMISDEIIDELVAIAQGSPNSINGQQTSIIAIRDKETKKKIAELTGGQFWIEDCNVFLVFVMDFYKAKLACEINERPLVITQSIESIMVGSVDAGIAMQSVVTAAESLGLGTVCIGGIRKDPAQMIQLLELPEFTFPVVGLCLGYFDKDSKIKPRMNKKAYHHSEKYNKDVALEVINNYDKDIVPYLESVNRSEEINWSQNVSRIYQTAYYPEVYPTLKKQGFENNK